MDKLIFTILLLLSISIFSQNCNCKSKFDWIKKTFEENDAGFSYAIQLKGNDAYQLHNKRIREKIKEDISIKDCVTILENWLLFFRDNHHYIKILSKPKNLTKNKNENVDLEKFYNEIKNVSRNSFLGVWQSGSYTIGIKTSFKKDNETHYKGFIIESRNKYWKKNETKIRLIEKNNTVSALYYYQDHSEKKFNDVQLIGSNILKINRIYFKRVLPQFKSNKKSKQFIKYIGTTKPILTKLSDSTLYFRIPSFNLSNKKMIDSLILKNKTKLLSTPNLIIDIRNNGGGTDASYQEVLPLLYTNPITTLGSEFLSTELNLSRWKAHLEIADRLPPKVLKREKAEYEKLKNNINKFVTLRGKQHQLVLDTIYTHPKNIGLIINKYNGSSAEQFILAAKQSKKVKLFGNNTEGVLDISNLWFADSPCNDLRLGYSLSKSLRIPNMSIDGVGIQPDYFINKQYKEYEWIDFVKKILNIRNFA